jgi:hypothetical protein
MNIRASPQLLTVDFIDKRDAVVTKTVVDLLALRPVFSSD